MTPIPEAQQNCQDFCDNLDDNCMICCFIIKAAQKSRTKHHLDTVFHEPAKNAIKYEYDKANEFVGSSVPTPLQNNQEIIIYSDLVMIKSEWADDKTGDIQVLYVLHGLKAEN